MPAGALAAASEMAIVALAMNADDAAYGELVRRRQGAIRHLLRRLTRDPALADDLAQQTFVQGWKSIRSLKAPGAFGGWLRKLAVNFWLQHARTLKHEVPADEDLRVERPMSAVAQQLDLDAALAQLPPDVRLCIVLAYSEGMSHGEISHTTQMPLGTVNFTSLAVPRACANCFTPMVTPMSDELDPHILALFAQTQRPLPSTEFIEAFLTKIERARRIRTVSRVIMIAITVIIAAWIMPSVLDYTALAVGAITQHSTPGPGLMISPWGWTLSMLVALGVLSRTGALPRRRRRKAPILG